MITIEFKCLDEQKDLINLFPDFATWQKWKTYKTERGAKMAFDNLSRKFSRVYEFRMIDEP